MELSELAAYAGQKYHIEEQHKWADFPGFSVLAEPGSGRWAALLMRQWDGETGMELQRADIKCGRQCLSEIHVSWLALPFRMKGNNWVGVLFGPDTDPEIVCRLFDRAVASVAQQNRRQAHLVELEPPAGGALRPDPRRGYLVELEPLRGNYQWPEEGDRDNRNKGAQDKGDHSTGAQGKSDRNTDAQGKTDRDGSVPSAYEKSAGYIDGFYHDTALPPRRERRPEQKRRRIFSETASKPSEAEGDSRLPSSPQGSSIEGFGFDGFRRRPVDYQGFTIDTSGLRTGGYASTAIPQVPQKIRDMIRLYEYRGESIEEKCRNFYRQGKFMEDYEDDAPWTGEYRRYFTTYHDLHLPQLRGYFTWRTAVRRGEFRPIAASLAYMYVYELLCGIGASSPEDSLHKMQEFEKGFLDSGIGDSFMRRNLHHWMLDYAVIHNVPLETAQLSEIPAVAERDRQMAVLREPERHTDEEIFLALCAFGGKKTEQSPVVTGNKEKGQHLFAALWRYLTEHYRTGTIDRTDGPDSAAGIPAAPAKAGSGTVAKMDRAKKVTVQEPAAAADTAGQSPDRDPEIFTACFGERQSHAWTPLTNAIHWEEDKPQEAEYVLNPCRRYRCHEGEWTEERYENPYFARDRLQGLLHAADKGFRRYLKTGHYLRAKKEEEWAEPWIEAVIAADREAEEKARIEAEKEAAMAKITIDLSGLDRIRRDARVTRDSLLTESEMAEMEVEEASALPPVDVLPANQEQFKTINAAAEDMPETRQAPLIEGLDDLHTQILCALIRGESVEALIREKRLMPSMVADTINESLYDEIGDIVLECDGDSLSIVEDYREDLEELSGSGTLT